MLTRKLAQLRNDTDGVSKVVGVILMVGIVVALAALVAAMVLGFGSNLNEPAPNAQIEFNTHVESGTSIVTITHDGGETISKENTQRVNIQIVRDGSKVMALPWAGVQNISWPEYVWLEQKPVTAGTSADLAVTDDTRSLNPGDEVQIAWISPSGGNSQVLGEYTVPGETVKTLDSTCLINGSVVDVEYDGNGTSSDPYKVTNATQLQCTVEEPSASYELVNDIDASETQSWNNGAGFRPVENFGGELRGNGYSINDLYIDRPSEQYVGVFGEVDHGYVSGVNMNNVDVTGGHGTGSFAGLVATSDVSGVNVNSGVVNGGEYVGGAVGVVANANVEQVTASVSVNANGLVAGGVIGVSDGATVSTVEAYGPVTGTEVVGGAVGFVKDGAVLSDAYAEGTVTATSDVGTVGGLVGKVSQLGTVENSRAVGDVTGDAAAGGAFGKIGNTCTIGVNDCNAPDSYTPGATVTGVVAEGDVSGGAYYTGGFAGAMVENTTVESSYATGNVTGADMVGGFAGIMAENNVGGVWTSSTVDASGNIVGGFVGVLQDGVVAQSYSVGSVESGGDMTGGFVGYATGSTIQDSYSHSPVTSGEFVGGFAGRVGDGDSGTSNTVSNVYATGPVTGSSSVGGAVGYVAPDGSHSFSGVYWDTESTGQSSSAAGTGLTTSEMQDTSAESNMPEFDFTDVWKTVTGDYPDLSWE